MGTVPCTSTEINTSPCTVVGGFSGSVDLAISEFPASREWMMAGQVMYHTSVIIQNNEFFFGKDGMQTKKIGARFSTPPSHEDKKMCVVFEVGHTRRSPNELIETMLQHFSPDSYDLLRKNCNSFTDCCLAYLISRRLPQKYSVSENLGKGMPGVVSFLTGAYAPNPKADEFKPECVVLKVDPNAWMGTSTPVPFFKEPPTMPNAKM